MDKLQGDWAALGSGNKPNDPIIGHPAMKGRRWQIDYAYPSNGWEKIKQADKETEKYKHTVKHNKP